MLGQIIGSDEIIYLDHFAIRIDGANTLGLGVAAQVLVQVPVTVDYAVPVEKCRAVLYELAKTAVSSAPADWELGVASVRIGELGRFGPIFVMTFSVRDGTDPLAVKDAVYALVSEAVRDGRLAIAFGHDGGHVRGGPGGRT